MFPNSEGQDRRPPLMNSLSGNSSFALTSALISLPSLIVVAVVAAFLVFLAYVCLRIFRVRCVAGRTYTLISLPVIIRKFVIPVIFCLASRAAFLLVVLAASAVIVRCHVFFFATQKRMVPGSVFNNRLM